MGRPGARNVLPSNTAPPGRSKIRLPIRAAFAHPWSADGWAEIREQLPALIAEEWRLRRHGWLN